MVKNKIKKVLVPIDGSKSSFKGLEMAIYMARQCGATITGMYVIPIYPRSFAGLLAPLRVRMFKEAKDVMTRAELISARKGIVFRKRIVYGDPKSGITASLQEGNFDLVVIGARGLGWVGGMFLGSVSNSVLHRAKIPVLVVR
ncbi:MAG: universal stress protein [Thaumarchaeota archaeon]|nr:universal stress protein [Nitrososphaerota archaeon]